MPSNGDLGAMLRIPAKIYPGMFERECEVTVTVRGREVNVIVPTDYVTLEGSASDEGTEGLLIVPIVDVIGGDYLIDLPGEALGVSRRMKIPKDMAAPVTD